MFLLALGTDSKYIEFKNDVTYDNNSGKAFM